MTRIPMYGSSELNLESGVVVDLSLLLSQVGLEIS